MFGYEEIITYSGAADRNNAEDMEEIIR